ncbi:hypothetical protein C8R44DRAFT_767532 [Mycena epipterygia]|nr:hypothetical protein C8R44DRAFT_767532 [Mycena epipterygia]
MFQDLPHDVIIRIMSYTGVPGIIALRQVSTSLSRACYQRIVWIEVLRAACVERNIFLPSFPISEMTLPQLEHAATASPCFLARIHREFSKISPSPLRPFSTRILFSFDSATECFKNMILVPGGRFLLTTCGRNVRLWDLGFHCGISVNPFPVASVDVGHSSILSIAAIQSSTNVRELLVLVISREPSVSGFLDVYRIFPSATQPQFMLFASAPVSSCDPYLQSFSERHVVVDDDDHIVLWNFVDDKWMRWDEDSENLYKISMCNDTLVALNDGKIQLMTIPPFDPRQSDKEPPSKNPGLILNVAVEPECSSYKNTTQAFGGSESTIYSPMHFDIQHIDEDAHERVIQHYLLKVVENGGKNGLPGCLPILVAKTVFAEENIVQLSSRLHWINEETVQFSWTTFATDVVHTHIATEDSPQGFSGELGVGADTSDGDFMFCPFSGRLCVRVTAGSGHEIRIMDYLAPP